MAPSWDPPLAELSSRLDEKIELPETWQYSAATATGLLSVLVGAMVGLIGFVVTVTVLVIQQATGTLSPRYMRLWYRDPFQKIVLATFAGTLTFSFSLLRRVTDNAVPDIGVTAAGVLVTISVLLLLWYVARFAHVVASDLVRAVRQAVRMPIIGRLEQQFGGVGGAACGNDNVAAVGCLLAIVFDDDLGHAAAGGVTLQLDNLRLG